MESAATAARIARRVRLRTRRASQGSGAGGTRATASTPSAPGAVSSTAEQSAPASQVDSPHGACPSTWQVSVTVRSLDPVWPDSPVEIQLLSSAAASASAAPIDSRVVSMQWTESPEATFTGTGAQCLRIVAAIQDEGWIPVQADGTELSDPAVAIAIQDGEQRAVELLVRRPLLVHVELMFTGPDATRYPLPAGLPVQITFPDHTTQPVQLEPDGRFEAEIPRKHPSFTLRFEHGSQLAYVVVPAGGGSATRLAHSSDYPALRSGTEPFFSLPARWSLHESSWDGAAAPDYDANHAHFDTQSGKLPRLGSPAAPARLVLDPHWQFLRFEYFDRYYGPDHHGGARVNTPPIPIDGQRASSASSTPPDTRSRWTLQESDAANSVHCLPWILQGKPDGSADPQPSASIGLSFETEPRTFAVSKSESQREIEIVTNAATLGPSADRLRYYDLPEIWRSKGYYVRYSDGTGQVFDDAQANAPQRFQASTARSTPLIFCLDDIVLTDERLDAISIAPSDTITIFHHTFTDAPGSNASPLGVYKPDTANVRGYASQVTHGGRSYLHDHATWTRAVIARGSLFDCFSERTPDRASSPTVGARAAVRWVDLVAASQPAGTPMPARPARQDFEYYSVQPAFEQQFSQTNLHYTGPSSRAQSIGRYDMILLRCAGHDAGTEIAINLHYFRLRYAFQATAPAGTPPSPYHPPDPLFAENRKRFEQEASYSMSARWSGNDTANTERAQIVPRDANEKLRADVVFFVQPVPAAASAHFRIDVVRAGAGAMQGRAWMHGLIGTGEFGEMHYAADNAHAPNSHTAAHELGHADSLPDEYSERWSALSAGELSFYNNTPGDAYEPDGKDWDPGSSTVPGTDGAMMTGVVTIRNRYFWHAAEFLRSRLRAAFKVKHGPHDNYCLPPHPGAPTRSYAYWPIGDKISYRPTARANMDIILTALGEERYTKSVLPNGPFDGALTVLVRIRVKMRPGFLATSLLPILRSAIQRRFNDKFYARGTVHAGTAREWTFERCLVRFSPRFLVATDDAADNTTRTDYREIAGRVPTHLDASFAHGPRTGSAWGATTPIPEISFAIDTTQPSWRTRLASAFTHRFSEAIGISRAGNVNNTAVATFAQQVIGAHATANDI